MYLGVDVGGTKVLVAVLDTHGVIKEHAKFPTPGDYHDFLHKLRETVAGFTTDDFRAAGIGIPTNRFDRQDAVALRFGNLPWRNVAVQSDAEKIFHCPVVVENDAKLAGLSEAMLLKDTYQKVLYVTISTGIGYALIADRHIDPNIGDGGGKSILLEHKGKLMAWEDFASGRAILKRYGKMAKDIHDEATWKRIAYDLGLGFTELIAVTQPDAIVVGGGVGTYFDRFKSYLEAELKKYEAPLVVIPPLFAAQRPEEAVVYGCYDLAKATFAGALK